MSLLQVAAPTPPPLLDAHSQEALLIALLIIAITIGVVVVFKPLVRAWARRIEGKAADPALAGEVEALREQVAELSPLRERVHELEERIEFTERLLAQRRDQELLTRGPQA